MQVGTLRSNVAWRATGVAHRTTSVLTGWRYLWLKGTQAVHDGDHPVHGFLEANEHGAEAVDRMRWDAGRQDLTGRVDG